jgi:fatty acid desaturase
MQEQTNEMELKDRLSLIESMIAEGRRTTESWGWSFVLWGVAYYVAIAWANWGHSGLAWPVTMIAASTLTGVMIGRKGRNRPATTMGRAIASIWIALGVSMFILFLSMSIGGKLESPQIFVAVAAAMLGMANAASGMILKWKPQLACAVVWWATAVFASFGSEEQSSIAFLVALFFCQIVFGLYGMVRDTRKRNPGVSHA